MIKYPVKVSPYLIETSAKNSPELVYAVHSTSEFQKQIATVYNQEDANIIAIALNAMNDFPGFNHPRYFDEVVKWIKIFISPNHKYNVNRNIRG